MQVHRKLHKDLAELCQVQTLPGHQGKLFADSSKSRPSCLQSLGLRSVQELLTHIALLNLGITSNVELLIDTHAVQQSFSLADLELVNICRRCCLGDEV